MHENHEVCKLFCKVPYHRHCQHFGYFENSPKSAKIALFRGYIPRRLFRDYRQLVSLCHEAKRHSAGTSRGGYFETSISIPLIFVVVITIPRVHPAEVISRLVTTGGIFIGWFFHSAGTSRGGYFETSSFWLLFLLCHLTGIPRVHPAEVISRHFFIEKNRKKLRYN